MISAKTANESTFFSIFNHRLKFWALNFNSPQLLQKMFVPHGLLFNNVYLHVFYHPSKMVGLVAKLWYIFCSETISITYSRLCNNIRVQNLNIMSMYNTYARRGINPCCYCMKFVCKIKILLLHKFICNRKMIEKVFFAE